MNLAVEIRYPCAALTIAVTGTLGEILRNLRQLVIRCLQSGPADLWSN